MTTRLKMAEMGACGSTRPVGRDSRGLRRREGHAGGQRPGLGMVLELVALHDVRAVGHIDGHDDRRRERQHEGEDEGEAVAAEERRPQRPDGRAEGEAADLEGAVVAEGLATLVGVGRVHDHAARGRVEEAGRGAGDEAQDEERREAGEEERQEAGDGEG